MRKRHKSFAAVSRKVTRLGKKIEETGDSFYFQFCIVVFGITAAVIMERFAEQLLGQTHGSLLTAEDWMLFVGVIATNVHFWWLCLISESIEDRVLCAAPFTLYAVFITLAFAFAIVVMGRSIGESHAGMLYGSYVWLQVISLGYDFSAVILRKLVLRFGNHEVSAAERAKHVELFDGWATQDFLMLLSALVLFCMHRCSLLRDSYSAALFMTVAVAFVVGDVGIVRRKYYLPLA